MMKLSTSAILAVIWAVQAQTQTIVTWFSTLTPSLHGISVWQSVGYGPTPVYPIPIGYGTLGPGNSTLTYTISEPTASRNINVTSWATVQATPTPGITTVLVTTTVTTFGVSTISMEGTGTSTGYKWSTPATITFTPTVCANSDGTLPKTTVTRYTGTYTSFQGQFPTTPRSYPTTIATYLQQISSRTVFPYTGTTAYLNATTTEYHWQSTTTLTSTSTSLVNGLISAIWTYSTYTTTTTTFWSLTAELRPTATLCSPNATATVTHAERCRPTNLISIRDERAVSIISEFKRDYHRWFSDWPGATAELAQEAYEDPAICCQICMDNAAGGCVASDWDGNWLDGCVFWYFVGERGSIWDLPKCEDRLLPYYSDEKRFPGQGHSGVLQAVGEDGCGGLRYIGRDQGPP